MRSPSILAVLAASFTVVLLGACNLLKKGEADAGTEASVEPAAPTQTAAPEVVDATAPTLEAPKKVQPPKTDASVDSGVGDAGSKDAAADTAPANVFDAAAFAIDASALFKDGGPLNSLVKDGGFVLPKIPLPPAKK